jgi:hypothetical protein
MGKIKDFVMGLSKSTKITLVSCSCFVLLTLLIMTFFVLFPVTPSDKAISKLGSEGLVYQDDDDGTVSADSPLVTTAVTSTNVQQTNTTAVRVTTAVGETEQKVTFTTISGFFSGGYVRTGTAGVTEYQTSTATVSSGSDSYDYSSDYETPPSAPDESDSPSYTEPTYTPETPDNSTDNPSTPSDTGASDPVTPVDPGTSSDPVTPVDPGTSDPVTPVDPGTSSDPVTPDTGGSDSPSDTPAESE